MKLKAQQIAGLGLFTAIVVVLQALAVNIRFGIFSITLVLIPIVVGAALYGWLAGAWLGLVFGVVVLFTDAGAFLAISVPGTILTCVLKGMAAGAAAGAVYKLLEKKNTWIAVMLAALVAPICNTGIFLLGCRLFFFDTIKAWAEGAGFANAGAYMIFGLVGMNFIVETATNLVLSTVAVQLIRIGRKSLRRSKTA